MERKKEVNEIIPGVEVVERQSSHPPTQYKKPMNASREPGELQESQEVPREYKGHKNYKNQPGSGIPQNAIRKSRISIQRWWREATKSVLKSLHVGSVYQITWVTPMRHSHQIHRPAIMVGAGLSQILQQNYVYQTTWALCP